jgi:HD-like signal output (HDOD) protein
VLANDNTETLHLVYSQGDGLPGWGQGPAHSAAAPVPGTLPAMDNAVLLLQVLLASPAVNLQAVADVIRNDVGLTVELIKSVCRENDRDQTIETNITNNVVHAGLDKLRHLASTVDSVSGYMCGGADLLKYERFWGQARLTGLIAEELAYRAGNVGPEEAYVAGLLFRIGELPAILGNNWKNMVMAPREMARLLAKTWRLPGLLADVVYDDNLHASPESRPLMDLVRVADRQARRIHGLASNFARGVF